MQCALSICREFLSLATFLVIHTFHFFNVEDPSDDGDNVEYYHHSYTEQSSTNKITNIIRSISHSLQKWYHGIQSRQFSENTIGVSLNICFES